MQISKKPRYFFLDAWAWIQVQVFELLIGKAIGRLCRFGQVNPSPRRSPDKEARQADS
jgi:hypothetical protein